MSDWINGKVAVVTGANSGIGKQITSNLAGSGARVVMACRSVARGEEARRAIADATGSDHLRVMRLDLANQASIRRFANEVAAGFPAVDVLINNAGIQLGQRELTEDGVERVFATNVLGPQLLTQFLLPKLSAADGARIINIASSFAGEFDVTDLEFERRPFHGTKSYKQSKACNRLLTWELARRLAGTGITANAVSPGLVGTRLYRGLGLGMRMFMRTLQAAFGVSIQDAADTATWLATDDSDEVVLSSGVFFEKRRPVPCKFADPDTERRLWEFCDHRASAPSVLSA